MEKKSERVRGETKRRCYLFIPINPSKRERENEHLCMPGHGKE